MKKIIYICLTAILFVGIAIVAILFGAVSPILNGFKDQYLSAIEAEIGRKVDFDEIEIAVLPSIRFELKHFKIADPNPQHKPLLHIDRIAFKFKLMSAILSLGKEIEISELLISGLNVDLSKNADGTLSIDDILAKMSSNAQTPTETVKTEEKSKRLTQAEKEELITQLKAIRLKSMGIQQASFHYTDLSRSPTPIEINAFNLMLKDFSFDQPIGAKLSMGFLSKDQNMDLEIDMPAISQLLARLQKESVVKVEVDEVDEVDEAHDVEEVEEVEAHEQTIDEVLADLSQSLPLPIKISLKLQKISFTPILSYLPADIPADLQNFHIESALNFEITENLNLSSMGFFHLLDFKIKEGNNLSQSFNIKLNPNFKIYPKEGQLDIDGFVLMINHAVVDINAKLRDLYTDTPKLEKLKLSLEKLKLDDFSSDPVISHFLPPKSQFAGPVEFQLNAQGTAENQIISLNLDLDQTTLILPKQLVKKAGQTLHLKGKFKLSPQSFTIDDFFLKLQDLNFKFSGQLSQFKAPQFDFKGDTGAFDIDRVVRLLPSVASSIPDDVRIDGKTELSFKINGNVKDLNSAVKLSLSQMNLKTPELQVLGSGHFEFSLDGNVEKNIDIQLRSNFNDLDLKFAEDFHKPKSVPFEMDFAVNKTSNQIKVPKFLFHLADLKLSANVKAVNEDQISLTTQIKQANLSSIFALLPSMKESSIKNATLSLDLDLSTKASQMNKNLTVHLNHLEFKSSKNHILGELTFKNPLAPQISFDFKMPKLDSTEFESKNAQQEAKTQQHHSKSKPQKSQPVQIPKILYQVDLNGSFSIDQGKVGDLTFKNYRSHFKGKNGKYSIQNLSIDIYGGQIKSNPMSVDLKKQTVMADLDVKKIRIEEVSEKKDLTGYFSSAFQMNAKGLDAEKMKKTMSSQMSANIDDATLHGFDPQTLLYKAIRSKIPGLKAPKPSALQLKDLGLMLGVQKGKLKSNTPIKFKTDQGDMEFNLSADLDMNLGLKGTWFIPTGLVEKLISKKMSRKEPIPLKIELVGNGTEFKVKEIHWEPILLIIVKEIGGKALEQGVDQALDQLGGKKGKAVKDTAKKVLKKIF